MGLLDKLFGKKKTGEPDMPKQDEEKKSVRSAADSPKEPQKGSQLSSKDVIDAMHNMADIAMDDDDYERAAQVYKNILELGPDATAQYNLGSFYAQGKGVRQDFMEGAYWFHQAELGGDEQAGKLCTKCSIDFIRQNLEQNSPEQLYMDMERFVKYVYPDTKDVNQEVCRKLYALAQNHFSRQEYDKAAKLFRAAAQYGSDGYSQNYLAVLYNAGAGLPKNDLASLYWFDKAVDQGAADVAQKDRDGMLNAYKTNFSATDFYEEMMRLSGWCSTGNADVPKDAVKAAYWREVGESRIRETTGENA